MLKVFLVEDEVVVREGFKKNINWQEHGLSFVGEANDGELAYPLIQELRPDIIITDIKMPFMDGLQLSRLVKKEMPAVKIIILSGYDEFEYAKEAIEIGVTEYLLKPISSAQIIETVLRVKQIIEQEQGQKVYLERFHKEMLEYEKLERKQFFKELVSKRLSVSELLDKGGRLGMELSAPSYAIVLFQLCPGSDKSDEYIEEVINLEYKLEAQFALEGQAVLFERDLEGFAVLAKGSGKEPVEAVTQRCLDILRSTLGQSADVSYFAAVSVPVQRLAELSPAFEEVRRAFVYRYIPGRKEIFCTQQPRDLPLAQDMDISLTTLDISKFGKKVLERFLRSGAKEDALHFVTDYFNSIGQNHMHSILFRQYIAMDAIFTVIAFVEELGSNKTAFVERCGDLVNTAEVLASVEGTRDYLTRFFTEALELRELSASQKYSVLLQSAQQYISENYSSDEISLNQVAATVNISPSHFSTIFSQETGSTFIEYLTGVRMEKAKELLRCSGMKTSEIGYAVGYRDPHYFSYLFKKRQGCTPKEFRSGKCAVALSANIST